MTLRIQKSDDDQRVVFRLIGRIQAEQIPELKTVLCTTPADHLILDLKDVKLVDREAVRFLAQLEADGAEFKTCSAFIRQWISQERNEMRRAVRAQQL
jgi:anti-anti-sigma regulatory factor